MHRWCAGLFLVLTISVYARGKAPTGVLSIMAYNVENLFDAVDNYDPDLPRSPTNEQDPAYLPMSLKQSWSKNRCAGQLPPYRKLCETLDWTEEKYEKKLASIAQVVLEANDGKGPDILVLEEVENRKVLDDLVSCCLGKAGLTYITHFEGPSYRGIDVAILSRRKPVRAQAHPVDLSAVGGGRTRDILEAEFRFGQSRLVIAANHWPSLANPTHERRAAAKVLRRVADDAADQGAGVLAAGDFNTDPQEEPNPIDGFLASKKNLSTRLPFLDLLPSVRDIFPPATHYYRGRWAPLDRFLVSRNLLDHSLSIEADRESFRILDFPFLLVTNERGTKIPKRFDPNTAEGYSDHLPIFLHLKTEN